MLVAQVLALRQPGRCERMNRQYPCAECGKSFARKDVVPPQGAIRPPGTPWRCRECHAEHVWGGFMLSYHSALQRRGRVNL